MVEILYNLINFPALVPFGSNILDQLDI